MPPPAPPTPVHTTQLRDAQVADSSARAAVGGRVLPTATPPDSVLRSGCQSTNLFSKLHLLLNRLQELVPACITK